MKKLFALIASFALVCSIATISMAQSSVTAGDASVVKVSTSSDASVAAKNAAKIDKQAIIDAAEAAAKSDDVTCEVYDIVNSDKSYDASVAFVRDTNKDVVSVLYKDNSSDKWNEADFTKSGSDIKATIGAEDVTFTLAQSSAESKDLAAPEAAELKAEATSNNDMVLWAGAAITLAACAGFCFFRASKKDA